MYKSMCAYFGLDVFDVVYHGIIQAISFCEMLSRQIWVERVASLSLAENTIEIDHSFKI